MNFLRSLKLFLLAPALAFAQPMAVLQYQYTAFVNVDAEFQSSLARCRQVAPESVPLLETLYESWRKENAASQLVLQKMVRDELRDHLKTDDAVEEYIRNNMREAKAGPVSANFPTTFLTPRDCLESIPATFRGEKLAIQFKKYLAQLTTKK